MPKWLSPILLLAFVLATWQAAVKLLEVPTYVLPGPSDVLAALLQATGRIGSNLLVTMQEASLGFFIGSLAGLVLAALFAESPALARMLLPYVVGSNAVPVIAIAPIIVLWFGFGLTSKVVLSAFLCFFPLCINAFKGFADAAHPYERLFRLHGATRRQFFLHARLPAAAPFIFAGAKLNATYAVIGAIVAEFVGADSGLGYGMLQASYSLNTPTLWAYLVVAVALGIAFYGFVLALERIYLHRQL